MTKNVARSLKQHFPRRSLKKPPPSWCMKVTILGKNQYGEIFQFEHRIYFGAYHGGMAKAKALPKLQSFLERISWEYKGNPKVEVFLKKISTNGNNGVPSYVNRERRSYFNVICQTHQPSKVFKVAR